MYTPAAKPITTLWTVFRELWRHLIAIVLYVATIEYLDIRYELDELKFPISVVVILGTVIGLLLTFRTNSCYCRWWEARTLWGAIVNDSRTWTRQLLEFTSPTGDDTEQAVNRMSYRQIAWCYSLSRSLRAEEPTQDLSKLLPDAEISDLADKHAPNTLLLNQGRELRELKEQGKLETFELVELEKTLVRLTDSMGGCERIRTTTFPRSYTLMVNLLIYLFVIYLPFGLVKMSWFGLVSISISFAMAFLMIDRVSMCLQDPFSNRPSDTPTQSLSRTIDINIREMLGETELPRKRCPVNGILK